MTDAVLSPDGLRPGAPKLHEPPPLATRIIFIALLVLGIGVFGLFSQLLQTSALRYGRVSSVVVMDYAQFGWSLLWGWLVFGHLPPISTWLGAPAIIAAGAIIVRREHLRASRA